MPHWMNVEVTQEMIDHSERQTETRCAVSIALAAANPRVLHPRVNRDEIRFSIGELRYRFHSPDAVASFIDSYDPDIQTVDPKPFKFRIDLDKAIEIKAVTHRAPGSIMRSAKYSDQPREARQPARSPIRRLPTA